MTRLTEVFIVREAEDWSPELPKNAREILAKVSDDELKSVLSALYSFRDDNAVIKSERDVMAKLLSKMGSSGQEVP